MGEPSIAKRVFGPDGFGGGWIVAAGIAGLLAAGPAKAENPAVTIAIDANAGRHAISPLIYGVALGEPADLIALGAPLNRFGGNAATMYNWRLNATNFGADGFFESHPFSSPTGGAEADLFVSQSNGANAAVMLTIPMLGRVAKLGPARAILPGFSVSKYGAQCTADPAFPDAGDGLHTGCATAVAGNDPNDASVLDSPNIERDWVAHLVARWGGAAKRGPAYYLMDNEPSSWYTTHRDVSPIGAHAVEIRDKVIATSAVVKAADPAAKVVATEEWGWQGYFLSGYDQQYTNAHGFSYVPDYDAVQGRTYYIPWLLKSWKAAGHPIDALSVHFYPQGGEYSDDVSTAMQLLRNRSTRQLWDTHYVAESWIAAVVELIPRLKYWVANDYYPGTPVAITEYNWGAENNINGATAQADILGIFGKYGLDLATRWQVPAARTPTYKAMQIYRNYDGKHSGFGDISISASVPEPDNLSAFAALRTTDGAMTVMVINKVAGSTPVTLALANFAASGAAQVIRLTAANAITPILGVTWTGGKLEDTAPPQSITLYVLPK